MYIDVNAKFKFFLNRNLNIFCLVYLLIFSLVLVFSSICYCSKIIFFSKYFQNSESDVVHFRSFPWKISWELDQSISNNGLIWSSTYRLLILESNCARPYNIRPTPIDWGGIKWKAPKCEIGRSKRWGSLELAVHFKNNFDRPDWFDSSFYRTTSTSEIFFLSVFPGEFSINSIDWKSDFSSMDLTFFRIYYLIILIILLLYFYYFRLRLVIIFLKTRLLWMGVKYC